MTQLPLSRRGFLIASMAGAYTLLSQHPVWAKLVPDARPTGKLSLLNAHTGERLTVTYRDPTGGYDPEALQALNWILRCHYTNQVAAIDPHVIDYLNLVDHRFGGNNEIQIISGFRSPEYNRLLREEGRHVARHSLHLQGKAIDFAIPGVELTKVRRAAMNLRFGGVGFYPSRGFVHLDSGRFRLW